ncbi:hypothetical protein SUNI508_02599 [Seiridium unicorne]|uniref:Polyketide synthase n=1 Tax=Seiridium unicorne TaxID=138068 RepID=A0ABR2UG05_9PEZI
MASKVVQSSGIADNQACDDLLEPLALVGFSLKYPQDADTPEAFWRVLEQGRCLMTEWPDDRMNLDAFFHRGKRTEDQSFVPGAHFVKEHLGAFDAAFFGISATEAAAMDPQHRILLELTYQALENAGISMRQAYGSKTGVYSGSMADDYKQVMLKDIDDIPKYTATGVVMNMIANRISWFYNFSGPSINVDSACSSSLMALDFACQGLRSGACDMAVVAGSSMVLTPESVISLANMGFLSPSGRCFSFDDRANGYSRGEGFSVVVIKRLSDAMRDRNTIRAVIRSTGSNQDGHTPGITQPSSEAQAALIKDTYEKAGLKLNETRFFEAHGTGTALGDPREADAIGSVFRTARSRQDPLYVGALKSNIGHLEGGSGLAGVIKAVMVLEKGVIPPNANFRNLNPRIDADFLNLRFPTECIPWPSSGLRRASVASFGFGGSNSHVILDDAYNYLSLRSLQGIHCTSHHFVFKPSQSVIAVEKPSNGVCSTVLLSARVAGSNQSNSGTINDGTAHHIAMAKDDGMGDGIAVSDKLNIDTDEASSSPECPASRLIVLSAADQNGIERLADIYAAYFQDHEGNEEDNYLDHLAYTLASRRSTLDWRSFAVISSVAEMKSLHSSLSKPQFSGQDIGAAFVFTGQGAQYKNMGAELLFHPVFMASLQHFDQELVKLGSTWSVVDLLRREVPRIHIDINDPEYSQPMTTALEIALHDLLRSTKVTPTVVVGHSSGEIAAAYAAGALSMASACKIAYYRGQFASSMRRTSAVPGAMMSVDLSADEMRTFIGLHVQDSSRVHIACFNSPYNVTISGDEAAIDSIGVELGCHNIRSQKLNTGVAYHSPHMRQITDGYAQSISQLERGIKNTNSPCLISTVTGQYALGLDELCNPSYWVSNMVSPVKFSDAMHTMSSSLGKKQTRKLGAPKLGIIGDVIEIGPHAALRRPIQDCMAHDVPECKIRYHSVLDRRSSATQKILRLAGELFSRGYSVDTVKINQIGSPPIDNLQTLVYLPLYPFNHSKIYWHESPLSQHSRLRRFPKHELLGTPVVDWNPMLPRWRKFFDLAETPWIEHHIVNNKAIYPATGMVAMALEGAAQVADARRQITGYQLRDAIFSAPMTFRELDRQEVELHMRPDEAHSDKNSSSLEYHIYSRKEGGWFENCHGNIRICYGKQKSSLDGILQHKEDQYYQKKYEEALIACRHKVPTEKMYDHLRLNGLDYGPSFRVLDDLAWDGENCATGEIECFKWTSRHSRHERQTHIAHPVTLDAAGQIMWVALTKGAQKVIFNGVAVTRIQSAWIASSGFSYPNTESLRATCTVSLKGLRGTDSSMFAMDAAGNLKLVISHLETTAVGGDEATMIARPRQICFGMTYKPDIDLMDADQIAAFTKPRSAGESEPESFYQDLELILLYYASLALEQKDVVTSENPLEPWISKYVAWLRLQLLRYHAGELHCHDWAARITDSRAMDRLIDRIRNTNAEGRFFVSVGCHLGSIISGQTNPLEVMFQSGLAENHYQEVCDKIRCCKGLAKFLDVLSHKNPQLKILEIGAGTGSITKHVLGALCTPGETAAGAIRASRYEYTDISEAFFEQAREKFSVYDPTLRYKLLDIEKDPVSQGYEPESYDVIVAAWVLHATHDLAATIQRVRRLLKPNGKLILLEITKPAIFRNGFAFGTLPGWWLSTEAERKWSPCVSEHEWERYLLTNGFQCIDVVLPDYESDICHENSILIATADDGGNTIDRSTQGARLILNPSSHLQHLAAENLQNTLWAQLGLQSQALNINDTALSQLPSGCTLVFLVELCRPYLSTLDQSSFETLKVLLGEASNVIWVTSAAKSDKLSAELHMVRGLARVLSTEKPSRVFVTLSLENENLEHHAYIKHICQVFTATTTRKSPIVELEYVECDGTLMIGRVFADAKLNQKVHETTHTLIKHQRLDQSPPLISTIANPGLLDSMRFEEDSEYSMDLGADEIEIQVQAVGVNFRDLQVVLGRYGKEVGCECAGIVTRIGINCDNFQPGDRVCAIVLGCSRTFVRFHYQLAVKIPDFLSTAEAASLPTTGVTAYHSLISLANLQKEESILIHSAAGGTGQMALQIAQFVGADVYVTTGSEEKKELLKSSYGVPESRIFGSRDNSFARDIMRATDGKGVDVVLNSLSGEALVASWDCIAPGGRFLELGKMDIEANAKLPMARFANNVSFHAVAVDFMAIARPLLIGNALRTVMNMVSKHQIHVATPLQTYPISESDTAFRIMQTGKNIGKAVLLLNPSDVVPTWLKPKLACCLDPSATYLISGGLGGLGRSAAKWMSQRGAKHLILLSRSGPRTTPAIALLEELRGEGISIRTPKCDVSSAESLSEALKQCSDMPPIQGCLQATMVLQDSLFETMSWDQWSISIRSKVASTWNLHRQLPSGLSFFIMLSSVAGIAGSMGQSNYAAGNTYQDALAAHRLAVGEKATSIDLGWMGDVGIVAENDSLTKGKEAAGDLAKIQEVEFLALLDHYCGETLEIKTSEQAQPIIGLVTPAQFRGQGIEPPDWLIDRLIFSGLEQHSNGNEANHSADGNTGVNEHDWVNAFICAQSSNEAGDVVVEALVQKLSKATSITPDDIDRSRPLHTFGVDSLLAVEIRNWFGKLFKADVAIFDITGQASLEEIARGAAGHCGLSRSHVESKDV